MGERPDNSATHHLQQYPYQTQSTTLRESPRREYTQRKQPSKRRCVQQQQCSPSPGAQCPHQTLPTTNIPYMGDYRGCIWNTQALFATDVSKQKAKRDITWKLADNHDFTGVVETHGLPETLRATNLPRGYTSFWSHETSHQGGMASS